MHVDFQFDKSNRHREWRPNWLHCILSTPESIFPYRMMHNFAHSIIKHSQCVIYSSILFMWFARRALSYINLIHFRPSPMGSYVHAMASTQTNDLALCGAAQRMHAFVVLFFISMLDLVKFCIRNVSNNLSSIQKLLIIHNHVFPIFNSLLLLPLLLSSSLHFRSFFLQCVHCVCVVFLHQSTRQFYSGSWDLLLCLPGSAFATWFHKCIHVNLLDCNFFRKSSLTLLLYPSVFLIVESANYKFLSLSNFE